MKKQWKKCKSWLFINIETTLETINLGPKQIKFLINIKNEKIDNKKENAAASNIKEKLKKDEEKERKKQKKIRINGYNLSDTNNIWN